MVNGLHIFNFYNAVTQPRIVRFIWNLVRGRVI